MMPPSTQPVKVVSHCFKQQQPSNKRSVVALGQHQPSPQPTAHPQPQPELQSELQPQLPQPLVLLVAAGVGDVVSAVSATAAAAKIPPAMTVTKTNV
jgi:hypothetical protein